MVAYMALPGLRGKAKLPLAKRCTIGLIEQIVCDFYGVPLDKVSVDYRGETVVLCRHMIMYLARMHTKMTLKDIGWRYGGRDHSTVINAIKSIQSRLDTEELIRSHRAIIEEDIFG